MGYWPVPTVAASPTSGGFRRRTLSSVLGGDGAEEARYATLAEAVAGSSPGDTIEIRGNGPFVTGHIEIDHALTIRAGDGFRPKIVGERTVDST